MATNYGIQQAFKRSRGNDERSHNNPHLRVTTSTFGETSSNDSMITVIDTQKDGRIRRAARNLDRLNDKQARFESHKQFLERCITASVIPKGLQIELEPSIGNHNEEFLAKWNEKLTRFSRELTQDVIEFCGTTVAETATLISEAKEDLKQCAAADQVKDINETLEKNQSDRTQQLRRNKDRKFYKLKFNMKPRQPRHQYLTSDEEPPEIHHPSRQNQPGRSTWNKDPHLSKEDRRNHQQPFRANNMLQRRERSRTNLFNRPRSRNNSNTNLNPANQQQDDASLLDRIRQLEAKLQTNQEPRTPTLTTTTNATTGAPHNHPNEMNSTTNNQNNMQKNLTSAQSTSPGAPPKVTDMLDYITATMQTLNTFKQHLTELQSTDPTRSETC